MSVEARREKQRKTKNCKMVSYTKLLLDLCLFFLLLQFSQVMSYSSHVAHELKTGVFFLFP